MGTVRSGRDYYASIHALFGVSRDGADVVEVARFCDLKDVISALTGRERDVSRAHVGIEEHLRAVLWCIR